MGAYKLDAAQKDAILNKLAELGQVASGGNGVKKTASTLSATDKEQIVTSLLKDQSGRGLRRIAYAMTEPLVVQRP